MISSHMHAPEGAVSGALAGGTLLLAGADPVGLVLGVAAAVLSTFMPDIDYGWKRRCDDFRPS